VPGAYQIRAGYTVRPVPEYDRDTQRGIVYQPDVYRDAARIAEGLGSARLVDLGCGTGGKLAALAGRFDVVGIDYGPNIQECRSSVPRGTWLEHDLSASGPLPLSGSDLSGAVLICADVIEHLTDPIACLDKVRAALVVAKALLSSTPERDLTYFAGHPGPPPNPSHVQEWNVREFAAFMRRQGFLHGTIGLTRSHDLDPGLRTIMGVYVSEPADLATVEGLVIDAPAPPGARNRRPDIVRGVAGRARRRIRRELRALAR
jgi:SAM-dependent methyltransferase